MKKHLIKDVVENSIADQLEIKSGDYLVSIDGNEIKDVFDYHLFSESSNLTVEIEDSEGEVWEIDIEKELFTLKMMILDFHLFKETM